jgi:protein-disulfide isomerase
LVKRFWFAGFVAMAGWMLGAQGQAAAGVAQAAPAAVAGPSDPFPAINPKYFTATTPSVDTVNAFLKAQWGFDPARVWKVMAVQSTAVAGVSKVTVFLTDKPASAAAAAPKVQSFSFFTMPDGKHAIADGAGVIPFGPNPFSDARKMMEERADGAAHGAAGKDLLLVEFADMQCPHCKTAQATMKQLAADFPQARIVYQSFPLVQIHPAAFEAAAYGVCVQRQKNDAFFLYSDDVFEHQEGLTPDRTDEVLKAAVLKAGLDPAAVAACAKSEATKAEVNASVKLAEDAGVDQTPMLSVNGRMLPMTEIPYETLKRMVAFQAQLDGVK